MEILLNEKVKSLTGSLGRGYGYHIQCRKGRFYGKRNSRGDVPPDGHLRFILTCAELAKIGLYVTDVKLSAEELLAALTEARKFLASQWVKRNLQKGIEKRYNAQDVINLKVTFGI